MAILTDSQVAAQEVQNIFNQSFGRDPAVSGLTYWVNRATQTGMTPEQLQAAIIAEASPADKTAYAQKSGNVTAPPPTQTNTATPNNATAQNPDAASQMAAQIGSIFQSSFGRQPQTEGLTYWVNRALQNNMTPTQLQQAIIAEASPADKSAYAAKNPTATPGTASDPNAAIKEQIKQTFRTNFGRDPQQGALDFYSQSGLTGQALTDAILKGASPADAGYYKTTFGRDIPGLTNTGTTPTTTPTTPTTPGTTPSLTDYVGAAKQMAADSAQLNRYNQNTPTGSQSWSKDAQGNWTLTQKLTPDQQGLLDQQTTLNSGLASGLQSNLATAINSLNPIDQTKLTASPTNAGTNTQAALMSRLEPQFQRQRNSMDNTLANQGIGIGSEAWNNEQDAFNRSQTDAYTQAGLQGITADQNARSAQIQQEIALQNQPLNAFNSLKTGMAAPQPAFNGAASIAPPDYLNAVNANNQNTTANNNANIASNNSLQNGLFNLGVAGIQSFVK